MNDRTVSGSRCCSRKAENSTSRSLCVAMALPSHGGGGAGGEALAADPPAAAAVEVAAAAAAELGAAVEANSATSPDEPVPPLDEEEPLPVLADGLAPTA